MNRVKLSNSVRKLGQGIVTLNFPAGITCRENAPCASGCYAKHGNFLFDAVKARHMENYMAYLDDKEMFWDDIAAQLYLVPYRFFRYFSSGDIPDAEFVYGMVELAKKFPEVNFLCFTKQYEFVNEYIDYNGDLPNNLVIVMSAWGDWIPENPHDLPMSFVKFKNADYYIPADAHKCPKFCGDCVMTGCSCWHMKKGESTYFDKH